MKCELVTQRVAKIPGYEKLYFHFTRPKNGIERLLISALDFKTPQYVGGKEPKCSLYVGVPEQPRIEGEVARQFTPSYRSFSWQRFWKALRQQNPDYEHECRCGVWSKSTKIKGQLPYEVHKKHCVVLKELKKFQARIESTRTYQEALDAGVIRSKSKKPPKSKRRDDLQASAKIARLKRIAKDEKNISRRRASSH